MHDKIELHHGCWIVIPKGLNKRSQLCVTAQWVPPENSQMLASNWPMTAPSTQLAFYVRASTKGAAPGTDNLVLRPDYRVSHPWPTPLDEDVWNAAFTLPPGSSVTTRTPELHVEDAATATAGDATPTAAVVTSWQTSALAGMLAQISKAMLTAHTQVMSTRSGGADRLPIQAALSGRSILFDTTGIRTQGSSHGEAVQLDAVVAENALCVMARTIRDTYLPNEMSAMELQRWLSTPKHPKAAGKSHDLFAQLQAAYRGGTPNDADKGNGEAPKSWQEQASAYAGSGIAFERLHAIANQISNPNHPRIGRDIKGADVSIIVNEAIVGLAPWSKPDVKTTEAPSRLSILGQAFTLQMQLGMLVDLELPIDSLPAARDAIAAGRAFEIAVQPDFVIAAPTVWTRADASGWPVDEPAPDDPQAKQSVDIAAGLLDMQNAVLTNIELRQSYLQMVSEVKAVSSRLDFALQAPDKSLRDTAFLTKVKSGPLTLHVTGAGRCKAARFGMNDPDKKELAPPTDTVFTLQTLLIGVRPDLQIAYPGQSPAAARWRPLMARKLRYVRSETVLPVAIGEAATARMEGYIPLTRLSAALEGSWVADDELFAWSGWNPAIPLPGHDTLSDADRQDLHPEATPIPSSNPAFRYGSTVRARARVVLRDGTNLFYDDAKVAAASQTKDFVLCRYEPLKAPAVLMAWAPRTSNWLPPESLTHVVLGTGNSPALVPYLNTVRYWLPGEIKDLFELDRHGAFDSGRTPSDTAFPGYERSATGFPVVDVPDPTMNPKSSGTAVTSQLPLFRSGPNTSPHSYYPDPLVDGIVIALARKSYDGQWWPIYRDGKVPCCVHRFYPGERRWPEAVALRIEFDGAENNSTPALRYRRLTPQLDEALLHVSVPAGERFSLVAWPIGQYKRLKDVHAYGALAQGAFDRLLAMTPDHHEGLPFPADGVSGLLSETSVIEVEHFVVAPKPPSIVHKPITDLPIRGAGALHQPYAVQLTASPGSVGGVDVVARWVDPVDDPSLGAPRYPQPVDETYAIASGVSQATVATFTSAWHTAIDQALSDPQSNLLIRPPMTLPMRSAGQMPVWLQGQYALPDGKHRFVRCVPVAQGHLPTATNGPLVDPATRTREGTGTVVNVLASVPPVAPVVRDILPAFRFHRERAPSLASSERHTAVTLILERGWWSSGAGELLGIYVRHDGSRTARQADAAPSNMPDLRASAAPVAISCWGADAALSVDGRLRRQLQPGDFGSVAGTVQVDGLVVDGSAVDLVLYEPAFDASQDAWRVDVQLKIPVRASQPFVQFAIARYQPDAIATAQRSPVTMVDFVQWQDDRFVSVVPEIGDPSRYNIVVRGPQLDPTAFDRRELTLHLEFAQPCEGDVIWAQRGERIPLTGRIDTKQGVSEWRAQVTLGRRERFERTRVCLIERGRFSSDPVNSKAEHLGPLYFLERLEFGDDVPREPGNP